MRYPFLACSVLAGIVGCLFFHLGGFMLFPVALDLWDQAVGDPVEPALAPAPTKHGR
jgi:hypothetical protein